MTKPGDSVFVHATVTRYDDHTYPDVEIAIGDRGLVRTFHRDDLFWPPQPGTSPWQCLYGPVRALINRINNALGGPDDDKVVWDVSRQVSPMHMKAQIIVDAQALLAEDVARARAIRGIVAAQWAVACALFMQKFVRDSEDFAAGVICARGPEGDWWRCWVRQIEKVAALPTAEQIVDGAT